MPRERAEWTCGTGTRAEKSHGSVESVGRDSPAPRSAGQEHVIHADIDRLQRGHPSLFKNVDVIADFLDEPPHRTPVTRFVERFVDHQKNRGRVPRRTAISWPSTSHLMKATRSIDSDSQKSSSDDAEFRLVVDLGVLQFFR